MTDGQDRTPATSKAGDTSAERLTAEFAERLRDLRTRAGLSLQGFERRYGFRQARIARYEPGPAGRPLRLPPPEFVRRLLEATESDAAVTEEVRDDTWHAYRRLLTELAAQEGELGAEPALLLEILDAEGRVRALERQADELRDRSGELQRELDRATRARLAGAPIDAEEERGLRNRAAEAESGRVLAVRRHREALAELESSHERYAESYPDDDGELEVRITGGSRRSVRGVPARIAGAGRGLLITVAVLLALAVAMTTVLVVRGQDADGLPGPGPTTGTPGPGSSTSGSPSARPGASATGAASAGGAGGLGKGSGTSTATPPTKTPTTRTPTVRPNDGPSPSTPAPDQGRVTFTRPKPAGTKSLAVSQCLTLEGQARVPAGYALWLTVRYEKETRNQILGPAEVQPAAGTSGSWSMTVVLGGPGQYLRGTITAMFVPVDLAAYLYSGATFDGHPLMDPAKGQIVGLTTPQLPPGVRPAATLHVHRDPLSPECA